MPVIKTPDAGQGSLLYKMGTHAGNRAHGPNYIFAMESAPDAPRDEEGVERKTEGEWELKGTRGV